MTGVSNKVTIVAKNSGKEDYLKKKAICLKVYFSRQGVLAGMGLAM